MNELDLFAAAIAIADPNQRAVLLDRECAGKPERRRRLDMLLEAHARAHPMLDVPGRNELDATGECASVSSSVGAIIAGRYKLLEEIGEGGMGTVWMAEQREPVKRLVAVKLIKAGMDSKSVLARFEAERQALALMDHPNIAKVHDGGTTDDGRPYFVMELVKGLPLTEYCDARRLSVRDRLDLFVQICSAVQHAHQKAVIHRDLKPTNVLVTEHDGKPVPKVIDFGLAKALNSSQMLTDRTLHTAYGTVVGTPLYMAPEQVGINALDVDTRTDVYTLGVILYELLTGTTPLEKARFKEAAWEEVKRLIREEEPPLPSTRLSTSQGRAAIAAVRQTDPAKLSRLMRGELDWIVMKALEKDRSRRYETANGLARDVQRFLADEPVTACPPSLSYRVKKFARRNKAALISTGLVAGALIVGLVASIWQTVAANAARAEADEQREVAEEKEREALASEARMREAEQARRLMLADTFAAFGQVAAERDDPGLATLWYAHAAELTPDDPHRVENHRLLASTWKNQAPQPVAMFQTAHQWVDDLRWHPSGRYVYAHAEPPGFDATGAGVVYDLRRQAAWHSPSTSGSPRTAAWNPAGDRVALAEEAGTVLVQQFPDGPVEHRIEGTEGARQVVWSPDGKLLAIAAGKTVRLIDAQKGEPAMPALNFNEPVQSVVFHPRSDRFIATTAGQSRSNYWLYAVNSENAKPINAKPITASLGASLISQKLNTSPPVFVEDGRFFVTPLAGSVRFYSAATGSLVGTRSVLPANRRVENEDRQRAYFSRPGMLSPDGRHFFVGNAYTGSGIMDVASRTMTRADIRHTAQQNIHSVSFSPNGRTLATGGGDRLVRFWSVPNGEVQGGPMNLPASVQEVQYSPDGRLLALGLDGGQVRVYRLPGADSRQREIEVSNANYTFARLSADGRYLLPTGLDTRRTRMSATRVFDVATGKPASNALEPGGVILDADLSPTKPLAAVITSHPSFRELPPAFVNEKERQPGRLCLWAWKDGKERHPPIEMPGEPRSIQFAPDGRTVATLCSNGHVVLIDPVDGSVRKKKVVRPAQHSNNWYYSNGKLAYGPGGRTLWVYTMENRARALDAETLDQKYALEHQGYVEEVDFSPDGKRVSTASRDGTARVWDIETGRPLCEPLKHPDWIFRAPFSPDGTKLLTAGRDTTARLWDWQNTRELFALKHNHEIHALAFTPDGRHVFTASDDKTARMWDARTGKSISKPMELPAFGLQVLITADGRHAVVCGFDPRIQIFDLEDLTRAEPLTGIDLITWGELVSGKHIVNSSISILTAEQWGQRWNAIAPRHPELLQVPEGDQLATHRREAHANEEARQWSAALPHLNELLTAAPRDQVLLLRRGKTFAELGRYQEAYADYLAAWNLGSLTSYEIHRLVLLALAKGDRTAAGQHINRWTTQILGRNDSPAVALLLWTFVLGTDVRADLKLLEQLVGDDAAQPLRDATLRNLDIGTAGPSWMRVLSPMMPYLLRIGHVDPAWDRLQQELPLPPSAPPNINRTEAGLWASAPYPEPHCFLAILHARRAKLVDAETALERARTLLKPRTPSTRLAPDDEPAAAWHAKLIRSMLLEEAEKAVEELRNKAKK